MQSKPVKCQCCSFTVTKSSILFRVLCQRFRFYHFHSVWNGASKRISTELVCAVVYTLVYAFSALTLLVGWQEGHPACKKQSGGCGRGYLSGAMCRFAHGPADATATHCLLLQ